MTAILDTFPAFTEKEKKEKSRFHSGGVAKIKKGARHPNKKPTFAEKAAQTRAADGVSHRILENVTFERRERRPRPPRGTQIRATIPRAPGQR